MKIRCRLLLSLSLLLACAVTRPLAAAEPLELALIVGSNRAGADETKLLRFADDDALRTAFLFPSIAPKGSIELLTRVDVDTAALIGDAPPTAPPNRESFEKALRSLNVKALAAHAAQRPVVLYFFFVGFGKDGGILQLEDADLTPADLVASLEKVGANHVFAVLDAAYPAQMSQVTGQPLPHPALIPTAANLPVRPAWLSWIGATTTMQQHNNAHGGLLSSVALNGLLGPADLDRNGRVSFFEWSRYVTMQIETSKPFAPVVKVLEPARDALATVVDLERAGTSGLALGDDVPNGVIQIRKAEGRTLVTQWYHHQQQTETVRLPTGSYELTRYSDRTPKKVARGQGPPQHIVTRIYPAERMTVMVGTGAMAAVNIKTESKRLFLVPESQTIGRNMAREGEAATISDAEELALINLLLRTTREEGEVLPPAHWSFSARGLLPIGSVAPLVPEGDDAPSFTAAGEPDGAGLGLRFTRVFPKKLVGRWYYGRNFLLQYGASLQRNVDYLDADGHVAYFDLGTRHQIQLGPGLEQQWIGPWFSVELREAVAWTPGLVVAEGSVVRDQGVRQDFFEWRHFYLTDVAFDASVALMVPVAGRVEIGPVVGLQAGFLNKADFNRASIQVNVGLEIRPRFLK